MRNVADTRKGGGAQCSGHSRRRAAHRAAGGHGRACRASVAGYLLVLCRDDRSGLSAQCRLPQPLPPSARFGHDDRTSARALRRGLHAQARRRQDRPPPSGYPLPRLPEAGRLVRLRCRRGVLFGRMPQVEGYLHAFGRGFGDRPCWPRGARRSTTPLASPTCSSCAACSTAWVHAYRASPQTF